jgi:hypothetical protein
MEHLIYKLYLISIAISMLVCAFVSGFIKVRDPNVQIINIIMPTFIITLFWPFILLASPAIALVYGIHRLGKFFGNR